MKLVAGLVALAVWAGTSWLGLTGFTTFQPSAATTAVADRGVARVTGCTGRGPVSRYGFGTWWTCRADVEWESGRRTRVSAEPGQLTPADQGVDVPVVQRGEGRVRGGAGNAPVYRADFEPSVVLGIGSLLGGIGIGGIVALGVLGTAVSRGGKAQERE